MSFKGKILQEICSRTKINDSENIESQGLILYLFVLTLTVLMQLVIFCPSRRSSKMIAAMKTNKTHQGSTCIHSPSFIQIGRRTAEIQKFDL